MDKREGRNGEMGKGETPQDNGAFVHREKPAVLLPTSIGKTHQDMECDVLFLPPVKGEGTW
jgi:hypothetical protein